MPTRCATCTSLLLIVMSAPPCSAAAHAQSAELLAWQSSAHPAARAGVLAASSDPHAAMSLRLIEERDASGVVRVTLAASGPAAERSKPTPTVWTFLRTEGRQSNLEQSGVFTPITIDPGEPGVTIVGIDADEHESPWSEIDSTLLGPVLTSQPDGGASVRRDRSCKIIIRNGGGRDSSAAAVSKSGQRGEIRPLFDPTSILPGSDLPLRAYLPEPVGGIVLRAIAPDGRVERVVTDEKGIAHVRLHIPGPWSIEAHRVYVEGPEDRPLGDAAGEERVWVHALAVLSFTVREEGR